jgi:hypothetical protein
VILYDPRIILYNSNAILFYSRVIFYDSRVISYRFPGDPLRCRVSFFDPRMIPCDSRVIV